MPLGTDYAGQTCSLARTLEIVGERWTLLIVRDLFFGVRRFTDLQRHLDVPRAVLAARLATLVEQGIVERRPYAAGRDELLLTADGEALVHEAHRLLRVLDDIAALARWDRLAGRPPGGIVPAAMTLIGALLAAR